MSCGAPIVAGQRRPVPGIPFMDASCTEQAGIVLRTAAANGISIAP